MALYLVQHGHALPREADPERRLSEQGCREVRLVADLASDRRIPVSRIVHSGKMRADQTAHMLAEELLPEEGVAAREGLGPNDDVRALADSLDAADNLMLVGHLPQLARLAGFLIAGTEDLMPVRFQMGGIVCLDRDAAGGPWYVRWTLMPVID